MPNLMTTSPDELEYVVVQIRQHNKSHVYLLALHVYRRGLVSFLRDAVHTTV